MQVHRRLAVARRFLLVFLARLRVVARLQMASRLHQVMAWRAARDLALGTAELLLPLKQPQLHRVARHLLARRYMGGISMRRALEPRRLPLVLPIVQHRALLVVLEEATL
jgi:hypothetical protein